LRLADLFLIGGLAIVKLAKQKSTAGSVMLIYCVLVACLAMGRIMYFSSEPTSQSRKNEAVNLTEVQNARGLMK
jgi:hypothetical protein